MTGASNNTNNHNDDKPAVSPLRLTIQSMAYGGKGVARHDGKVYFVRDTIPGDVVTAAIEQDNGRYADARIVTLLEASSLRQSSPCRYSDDCGGCQWLHIAYDEQLEWKRQFVNSALRRIGKLDKDIDVAIRRSPQALGYRNRVHLKLANFQGRLNVGYFRRQSHELVAIEVCGIADPRLNTVIAQLNQLACSTTFAGHLKLELQVFSAADQGDGRCISALFFPEPQNTEQHAATEHIATLLRDFPAIIWAGSVMDVPNDMFLPFEQVGDLTFYSRPGLFQQVNLSHNAHMRTAVSDIIRAAQPRRIMDVCCGSGNFSLPAADGERYIEGVEANPASIACAQYNASQNNLHNTRYLAGDATRHLWKCARQHEVFDLIILDPPREGLYEGMIPLANINPATIVYISCDPTTLARDIGSLCRRGYNITSVEAFDFFPNTYHVETLVVLQRK